jgi:S-adenosylmethionine hydrolase
VVHGEVLGADSFGNLLTNVAGRGLDPKRPVLLDGTPVPWCRIYGEAPSETAVALIGSDGYVEVAVRDGSALENLGAAIVGRAVCAPCKE